MNQKPYFRDVWALGPPQGANNGPSLYPGAFPRGFIPAVKKRWWGQKRLWLFSGSFKDSDGTTLDINPEVNADYACNAEELPFPDESFDFVMADPPYSEEEAMELYHLPYFSLPKVLNEMARVCTAGGYVLFLHKIIPIVHPAHNDIFKRMRLIAIVGVFTITGYSNIRALTVWRKSEVISE